jgi:carboxypeptidase family protein
MRRLRLFTVAFILLSISIFGAQSAQTVKLRGKVTDSTGAVMSATTVKAYQKGQLVKEAITDDQGGFSVDLAPGQYGVEVSAPDFTPYRETVQLSAASPAMAVALEVATVETIVNVTDDPNSVKVDLDSTSLGATTLTNDQLQDLPDNEDDLITYLQQLAGAKGGVDQTAQFIIDGFSGGRLPPKEQIAQIIIEDNPFGADAAGGGPRIRIITKPGTGTWKLQQVQTSFQDSALNTRNASATDKPHSSSRQFRPNVSGPLIPGRVTMNLQAQTQNNEADANASILAITPDGSVAHGLVNPTTNRDFNPRFNIRLDDKHRMNVNFSYSTRNNTSNGSGFTLAEKGSKSTRDQFSFQVSQSSNFGKMENEVRFQMRRDHSTTDPLTTSGKYAGIYSINVTDAFSGGPAANLSDTHNRSYQLADQLRGQINSKMQINTGIELNLNSNDNFSQNNYNGSFSYSSLYDFCYAYFKAFGNYNNWTNCAPTSAAVLANPTNPTFVNSAGNVISITGRPTQFTQRAGDPNIAASLRDASAYFETTLRLAKKFQMQAGVRYQIQQYVRDYNNVAPRIQMRYQLTKTTVLNGGAGIIHSENPFSLNNYENTLRNDGSLRQYQIQLTNPDFSPWTVPTDLTGTPIATTITRLSRDYETPYSFRTQFGVDQKLTGKLGFNVTYSFNRGVHQGLSRNTNAPLPDCVALLPSLFRTTDQLAACRPNSLLGNVMEYESVGLSRSKNLSFTWRMQNFGDQQKFNMGFQASYTLGWSFDLGNPSNNYNLFADWARSNNDQRHRVQAQISLNYRPWGLQMQLNPNWNSGTPYNITNGFDTNGDGNINDRPTGIARNTGQSPSNYNVSGSISKTFQLKRLRPAQNGNNFANMIAAAYAEPQRGGGGGGGFGGNQGGNRNDGGFGNLGGNNRGNNNNGGFRGDFPGGDFPPGDFIGNNGNRGNRGGRGNRGQQNDGPRVQVRFQVDNILNHPQERVQSGVLTSPYFGQIIGSGFRRLQISLNFQNLF